MYNERRPYMAAGGGEWYTEKIESGFETQKSIP